MIAEPSRRQRSVNKLGRRREDRRSARSVIGADPDDVVGKPLGIGETDNIGSGGDSQGGYKVVENDRVVDKPYGMPIFC